MTQQDKVRSEIRSLNALSPRLSERYISAIDTALQQTLGFTPKEIFWDILSLQAILAHPTFLDKLTEGFDKAIKSLPEEIIAVFDIKTNHLYFLARQNRDFVGRRSILSLATDLDELEINGLDGFLQQEQNPGTIWVDHEKLSDEPTK